MNIPRGLKPLLFTIFLPLFIGLFSGTLADAKSKSRPPLDTRILITDVNPSLQKVVFTYERDKKKQSYLIDGETQITVQNQSAKFDDIKVGMQVEGYINRDENTLESISVRTADPAPK
jgi:hypothetical protein